MKKIFWVLLGSITSAGAAEVWRPAITNKVVLSAAYLSELAEGLRTKNFGVAAAEARARASEQNEKAVRTWEDPKVLVGGIAAREQMRAEDGDILYGVEQKLPLFGKAKRARAVAGSETEVAQANTEYQFQLRRLELTKQVLQAALNDRLAAIGQRDLQWLETVASTLREQIAAGRGSQIEVLRAENEKSKRAQRLTTDINHRYHTRVAMNLMLNRDIDSPWPEYELPVVAAPIAHSPQLESLAVKFEPKLKMMRQEIKRAEANIDFTRRKRWPDISAGVDARNYTGDGSFRQGTLLLSMNVPWGNGSKYRSEISREELNKTATEWEARDYEITVREEVHKLLVMIDAARRDVLLYRDQIIPRSKTGLEAIQAAWESGRGTLIEVFEARRMLLEGETMYAQAVAEQYTAMAQLVLCCGLGDFEALEMISKGGSLQGKEQP